MIKRKDKINGPSSKYAKPFYLSGYRILNTNLPIETNGRRIVVTMAAGLYEDTRELQVRHTTIRTRSKHIRGVQRNFER